MSSVLQLGRGSVSQSDTNMCSHEDAGTVYSNIPVFMEMFTLIPSAIAFLYLPRSNCIPIRTLPKGFGITVHWDPFP